MKKHPFRSLLVVSVFIAAAQFSACKGKQKSATADTVVAVDTTAAKPAPVIVATDDELTKNVTDATKDFPGVKAVVSNGEITLTGDITRDKLPNLMMALNSLHPKKINNNLTISK
jgi:outer membrane receptor for ferrienterochelin and colicin